MYISKHINKKKGYADVFQKNEKKNKITSVNRLLDCEQSLIFLLRHGKMR